MLMLRLTHWGRVTHICVDNLTIIGSDNGLSPGRRQAIIWTNVAILLIEPLGTNFSDILIEIITFSVKENAFENVVRTLAAILSRPQWVNVVRSAREIPWWRHDMETLSPLLYLWEGNPPVTSRFLSHNASFDVFFVVRIWTNSLMNKLLNKFTTELVFLDAVALMWHHINAIYNWVIRSVNGIAIFGCESSDIFIASRFKGSKATKVSKSLG